MKAQKLFEKDTSSLKDGGFIFQAIISHSLSFDIKEGYVVVSASTTYPFDKSRINAKLHQVDLFPDLRTEAGTAALTYVVLSEVNNLARKFELAAEVVKRNLINPSIEVEREAPQGDFPKDEIEGGGVPQVIPPKDDTKVNIHFINKPELEQGKTKMTIDITPKGELGNPTLTGGKANFQLNPPKGNTSLPQPDGRTPIPPLGESIQEAKKGTNKVTIFYKDEVERLEQEGRLTRNEIKRLNALFFKNTSYTVTLSTDRLHLREISTASLDSGSPEVVLKISTSLKDEAFGGKVPSFENFKLVVSGLTSITVKGAEVANFEIFDPVEKKNDNIFRTILPSLILSFKTDQVPVETFTNKSSEIAATKGITYKDIFEFDFIEEDEEESTEEKNNKSSVVKENLNRKIESVEKQLKVSANNMKNKEAQLKIDEIKIKLNTLESTYVRLGESLYIRQELALLEKELIAFGQKFNIVL